MQDFLKSYDNYENLTSEQKREAIISCARFYEDKTLDYILSKLPKKKQKEFKKEPVEVLFADNGKKDVSFANNQIIILNSFVSAPKKEVFFKVAQNTICAVFVNLFFVTAGSGNKKTSFATIANGFMASITTEFASANQGFENDIMQSFAEILGEVMDMGPTQ